MKKILLITVILLTSCTKVVPTLPYTVDLGRQAQTTAITKVFPIVSNGNITITMKVTPEAKYSLQVTDLLEDEIKSFGFTASDTIYIKTLDLTSLKSGDYNLTLIDISGKESKQNLIIKK
jgi:hypothetical protein